jgi:AmmeMemoRadiSam system protein A/AmmeMemoRadiSam system protein B
MSIIAAFMVPHPPLIVPEVGGGSEEQVRTTIDSYERIAEEIAMIEPETIIISSPHSIMYADYFHISPGKKAAGDFGNFRASQVSFNEEYDTDLVNEIARIADKNAFDAGTLGEKDKRLDHGTMVPLYFIRKKYQKGKIVRLGLSGLPLTDHYRFGQMIKQAVERLGRKAVFIASGDLSHKLQPHGPYGFAAEGPKYDERIMDVCGRAAFDELFDFDESFCEKAAECGHRSFVIMAGVLDGLKVDAHVYSHQDVTGVGYGLCSFYTKGEDVNRHFLEKHLEKQEKKLEEQKNASDIYVRLARNTIEKYISEGIIPDIPDDLPKELLENQAGAFVSIHEHGRLRGCIGTILATKDCIAKEIIDNAISASTRDPRFDPIRKDELDWLEINVDILGEPEDIESKEQLDVKRYGVIVSNRYKRGLLLPDLDGVDTVDQQISIAKQKAGILDNEDYSLQRFEVTRHY